MFVVSLQLRSKPVKWPTADTKLASCAYVHACSRAERWHESVSEQPEWTAEHVHGLIARSVADTYQGCVCERNNDVGIKLIQHGALDGPNSSGVARQWGNCHLCDSQARP